MRITDEERRVICTALHRYGSYFLDMGGYAAMKDSRRPDGTEFTADDARELMAHGEAILKLKQRLGDENLKSLSVDDTAATAPDQGQRST